eukprot:gnl/MRDRNA2_/MRDRNA2_54249_c0_seq2.p1 gnl/MRDRNA2_/MRDRNA2_54249_c0~~gnl/MRDRNA2_/MRDRNA2_54249_c0_seq2.p1  ORF type:complete len:390 (+),score=48.65 gnl/MRDRNA2_/MRDRNA2_54249_c0_seq2:77-1246(+)
MFYHHSMASHIVVLLFCCWTCAGSGHGIEGRCQANPYHMTQLQAKPYNQKLIFRKAAARFRQPFNLAAGRQVGSSFTRALPDHSFATAYSVRAPRLRTRQSIRSLPWRGHRMALAPIHRREVAVRADNKEFNLPSPLLLGYAFLLAGSIQSATDLIARDEAFSNYNLLPTAFVFFFSAYNLLEFTGIKKADYYGDLEGFEVNSLSSQAAEWALADIVPKSSKDGKFEVATFAGGCFWGTELHFQRIPGVIATCVGYTQGRTTKPSYGQVCSGTTGHTEGIQMIYDPEVVSYDALCEKLLSTIDSALPNQVGNDRGTQYRHGIYPHTEAQAAAAYAAIEREQVVQGVRKVVTEVKPAAVFWPAEKYHQRYLQKGGQSAKKNETKRVRCYG